MEAMRFLTFTKACLVSRDTVSAEGIRYPGHPVFIKDWKPRSLTIWKARLLSATQRTISALPVARIR